MSPELQEYTNNLNVYLYRMLDSSLVLSEQVADTDKTICLSRPLQIQRLPFPDGQIRTLYIPWLPGENQKEIFIDRSKIMACTRATLEQKSAYTKYFTMQALQGIVDPEELKKLTAQHGLPIALGNDLQSGPVVKSPMITHKDPPGSGNQSLSSLMKGPANNRPSWED